MQKIGFGQIAVFMVLFTGALGAGVCSTLWLLGSLPLGDFRGVVLVLAMLVATYLYAFLAYRLFLWLMPLPQGELPAGSKGAFAAQVHFLFHLLLFNTLITTHFLPIPLRRLVYLALGARLGHNTYSAGAILDPPLTRIGDNSIVGHDAVLFAHVIEGERLALEPIEIGDGVTIGAKAVVMPGVRIGDGALVSAGAVVTKGTRIGPGEIWGGVPARCLRKGAVR
ncbi:MAG TPA: acyltransferase [Thiotrichales bacterium]|nr:acyltransferase [Thiotrichales bacterium]